MPTNKPEVVLPEAPPIPAHMFDKDQSIVWAAAWETLRKHVADTLTRPADGEFHECPHCKGWSRISAQQPAEAVAWVSASDLADSVARMKEDRPQVGWIRAFNSPDAANLGKPAIPLYTPPPRAIDIEKLRELVVTWKNRADESSERATLVSSGKAVVFTNCADELAALIGDGGEAKK